VKHERRLIEPALMHSDELPNFCWQECGPTRCIIQDDPSWLYNVNVAGHCRGLVDEEKASLHFQGAVEVIVGEDQRIRRKTPAPANAS
jgi:hypothetical protein